jgi:general secretion pathway protein F
VQTYVYHAVSPYGTREQSKIPALSEIQARSELEARGLLIISMKSAGQQGVGNSIRLRNADLLNLTRSIAALLKAGMPLAAALKQSSMASPGSEKVLETVRQRIEKGDTLAHALSAHSTTFTGVYVGVIRAGERTGDLAGAFQRLVGHLEKQAALRSRIQSAAVYPALLAVVSVLATAFLIGYVLPKFASILTETGAALPASTSLLIASSTWARNMWPLFVILAAIAMLGALAMRKSERGQLVAAELLLKTPVLGELRKNILAARFGSLSAVMLEGGSPLASMLDDVAASIGDPVARRDVQTIKQEVESGISFHGALTRASSFPPVLAQLVAVGENSGSLSDFLAGAADMCAESAERRMLRFVTLAEPLMILAFGLLIGFVAVSLLQAVYSVNGSVAAG